MSSTFPVTENRNEDGSVTITMVSTNDKTDDKKRTDGQNLVHLLDHFLRALLQLFRNAWYPVHHPCNSTIPRRAARIVSQIGGNGTGDTIPVAFVLRQALLYFRNGYFQPILRKLGMVNEIAEERDSGGVFRHFDLDGNAEEFGCGATHAKGGVVADRLLVEQVDHFFVREAGAIWEGKRQREEGVEVEEDVWPVLVCDRREIHQCVHTHEFGLVDFSLGQYLTNLMEVHTVI